MLVALAMADLAPVFINVPYFTKVTTSMLLETRPPSEWDDWTKKNLTSSKNGSYWKGVFSNVDAPAPALAPAPAPAQAPAPAKAPAKAPLFATEEVDPAVLQMLAAFEAKRRT
jgi:hypothetical protein